MPRWPSFRLPFPIRRIHEYDVVAPIPSQTVIVSCKVEAAFRIPASRARIKRKAELPIQNRVQPIGRFPLIRGGRKERALNHVRSPFRIHQ